MSAVVIIPARFGSTRFAAKILAAETGRPLVQHVVDQVRKCQRVRDVLVATDDQRIVEALSPFGTRCVMTAPNHKSGTDRVAEAARGLADDIIINVQGDEPEIEPAIVDDLIDLMQNTDAQIATAATPFSARADVSDPNMVKVAIAENGRAIYFSRSPIPFHRDAGPSGTPPEYFLHLGIYAFRRAALMQFVTHSPTALEMTEKLEQLRALEIGMSISVMKVNRASHGIDTAEQYADFVRRCRKS